MLFKVTEDKKMCSRYFREGDIKKISRQQE